MTFRVVGFSLYSVQSRTFVTGVASLDDAVASARRLARGHGMFREFHVYDADNIRVFMVYRAPSGLITEYPVNLLTHANT